MNQPAGLAAASDAEILNALRRSGRDNPMLGMTVGVTPDSISATRLTTVTDASEDRDPAIAALVEAVGTWLGTTERRVAASMVVLGYSARLVGPSIALLLRAQILLDLRPDHVWYSYRPEQGFRLTVQTPTGWRGTPDVLRRTWCDHVIDGHLAPLVDNVRRVVPVAIGLLWGNVASGLTGTLRTLAESDAASIDECHATGLALLGHGALKGSGRLALHNRRLHFTRSSCCLYYRLEGGGTCADCPLPGTITRFRRPGSAAALRSPARDCDLLWRDPLSTTL